MFLEMARDNVYMMIGFLEMACVHSFELTTFLTQACMVLLFLFQCICLVHIVSLAHLSRRPQFQRSSPLKPLGQSKPNFVWSILRNGERKFI